MTGPHKKPIAALLDDVGRAASSLADARCNPIVFHCTGTSMAEGVEGETALVARVAKESGAVAFSTAQAIIEALKAMGLRRVVLFSPYPQATNDHEKELKLQRLAMVSGLVRAGAHNYLVTLLKVAAYMAGVARLALDDR
jgi:maleate cis-trans isomerase